MISAIQGARVSHDNVTIDIPKDKSQTLRNVLLRVLGDPAYRSNLTPQQMEWINRCTTGGAVDAANDSATTVELDDEERRLVLKLVDCLAGPLRSV